MVDKSLKFKHHQNSNPMHIKNCSNLLKKLSMEEMFMEFMQNHQQQMQSQQASMGNLENQLGQMASALNNRSSCRLSNDTQVVTMEKRNECKTIDL